ncbi:PH domain-containing protein [Paenibacillus sp. FSL W8-0426]|uniref:PH domain-containing protein n=1 Tax=Paenibacillus sp. FSL W8-0426 TaxID=2921714 RepID=UPI0030DA419F
MKRIDPRAINCRKTEGWVSSAVCLIIVVVFGLLTVRYDWPIWIVALTAVISFMIIVLELVILPSVLYRSWQYAILEKEVELHHGLWVRKRTLIPMSRIQHVNTKQGPLEKRYGLSTVTFATAAGSHCIPGLSDEEADRVRRRIAEGADINHEEI